MLQALCAVPLEITAFPVGSHFVGWLPAGIDGRQLLHLAAANDLNLWLVSKYSIEPLARDGLILSYGDHDEAEIQDAVRRLATVMRAVWPAAATGNATPQGDETRPFQYHPCSS
jgi:GntR family transcriptional regulator/MocR family aminotransferase